MLIAFPLRSVNGVWKHCDRPDSLGSARQTHEAISLATLAIDSNGALNRWRNNNSLSLSLRPRNISKEKLGKEMDG